MYKALLCLVVVLLTSCTKRFSDEEKLQMCNSARSQLEKLYHVEGITPFAMSCQVEDLEFENDTIARGRLIVEFEDWSKKPSPKVNVQALVEFVKLYNISWRLQPGNIDVITSYTLLGTELSTNDSTYILKSFMNGNDFK